MEKKYKLLVVCGTGMGSSIMLKVQVERAVKENDLPFQVSSDLISSAKGSDADLFVCMADLVDILKPLGKPVVGIRNIVSRPEITEGLRKQLEVLESK
ncbi:MAG: PTS sugar transporter subunit IIB [Anaerolineaceae bacterium]